MKGLLRKLGIVDIEINPYPTQHSPVPCSSQGFGAAKEPAVLSLQRCELENSPHRHSPCVDMWTRTLRLLFVIVRM